ncbi:MAG: branched-chain amino acid ABC transporter permease [Ktedonobacteraceae bacterium]|nr:branched-chain amino acid ABC transporter permease [Ktedonobacteraceae bacterium]
MKILQILGLFALLAFSFLFPLLFSDAVVTTVAIFTLILMAAATGWNLFSGYTRYLSLGHATFYGLGAYILAVVCQVGHVQGGFPPLLLLPLIGLMTGLCSLPLGWIALRTRRTTFMVITIAIFSLVSLLPNLLSGITSQFNNIYLPDPPWNNDIFNIPFYYTALILLFCALAVSWWIRLSKFGLCLLAIGDDEDRAQGLGNKTYQHKLIAWTISSIFVGMAGALNTYYLGLLDPGSAFERAINIALPVTAFIGGIGTVGGPLLGAIFAGPLQQYLTLQYGNEQGLDLILYGALLLAVILVLPQGVGPTLQKYVLTRMAFYRRGNPGAIRIRENFNDIPGTPSLVIHSAVSHGTTRDRGPSIQEAEPIIRSIHPVPLPMRRGYRSIKASRLVPLSQEVVVDPSTHPSSSNR